MMKASTNQFSEDRSRWLSGIATCVSADAAVIDSTMALCFSAVSLSFSKAVKEIPRNFVPSDKKDMTLSHAMDLLKLFGHQRKDSSNVDKATKLLDVLTNHRKILDALASKQVQNDFMERAKAMNLRFKNGTKATAYDQLQPWWEEGGLCPDKCLKWQLVIYGHLDPSTGQVVLDKQKEDPRRFDSKTFKMFYGKDARYVGSVGRNDKHHENDGNLTGYAATAYTRKECDARKALNPRWKLRKDGQHFFSVKKKTEDYGRDVWYKDSPLSGAAQKYPEEFPSAYHHWFKDSANGSRGSFAAPGKPVTASHDAVFQLLSLVSNHIPVPKAAESSSNGASGGAPPDGAKHPPAKDPPESLTSPAAAEPEPSEVGASEDSRPPATPPAAAAAAMADDELKKHASSKHASKTPDRLFLLERQTDTIKKQLDYRTVVAAALKKVDKQVRFI